MKTGFSRTGQVSRPVDARKRQEHDHCSAGRTACLSFWSLGEVVLCLYPKGVQLNDQLVVWENDKYTTTFWLERQHDGRRVWSYLVYTIHRCPHKRPTRRLRVRQEHDHCSDGTTACLSCWSSDVVVPLYHPQVSS